MVRRAPSDGDRAWPGFATGTRCQAIRLGPGLVAAGGGGAARTLERVGVGRRELESGLVLGERKVRGLCHDPPAAAVEVVGVGAEADGRIALQAVGDEENDHALGERLNRWSQEA